MTVLLFLPTVVFVAGVQCVAGQASQDALTQVLTQFRDTDWEQRAGAFNQLMTLAESRGIAVNTPSPIDGLLKQVPQRADEIRRSLISLLETENRKARGARGGSLSEGYLEYRGILVGAVAGLHDRRAIPALLEDLPLGDGGAIDGLAGFGDASLDVLIKSMSDRDVSMRSAATVTVRKMLDPSQHPAVSPASRGKIKAALMKEAADPHYGIRIIAVEGLARCPGADVTALLQAIADHDPFSRPGDQGEPPGFPVRSAARRVLAARAGK